MKFNEFVDRLNEKACKFAGVSLNSKEAKEKNMRGNDKIYKYVLFIDREGSEVFTVEVMANHFTKEADNDDKEEIDIVFYGDEDENIVVGVWDWDCVLGISRCYRDEEIAPQLLLGQWEKQEVIDGRQNNS